MLGRPRHVLKSLARYYNNEAKIIRSKSKPIEIPKIKLTEYLWSKQEKWFDNTAIVCFETNRTYTYYQLYKRTLSLSYFLRRKLNLQKGDTLGIISYNVPEFPIAILGAIEAGLKVTTCNPNYTAQEIKEQLRNSDAKAVVTCSDVLAKVQKAFTDLPIIEISNQNSFSKNCISFEEITTKEPGVFSNNDFDVDDVAFLPYSSGTTGLPKGVELTHYNLVANVSQLIAPDFHHIEENPANPDIVPAFLPFFHIYGCTVVMFQALVQGAKLIAMPNFNNQSYIDLLRKFKPTVIYGPPLAVLLANNNTDIKEEDLACVRLLMSGAAPLGSSDVERFRRKTNNKVSLIQGYGMTETGPVAIVQSENLDNGIKNGGSGFLVANTEARIIAVDGLRDLGPNESGELLIKGPQVMKGYYKNPEATSDTFLEDGWLKTGDIAHYDNDQHFFITDRLKELIKVKGFQVAPAELEAILRTHPDVEDAAVVGIPHDRNGEAPKAFVVRKNSELKDTTIERFVAELVSPHKHLTGGISFIDAIPKTPSGKILRRQLKEMT